MTCVPAKGVRHGQKSDGLARWGGVNDNAVKLTLFGLLVDVQQAYDFVHTRKCRQFIRDDIADSRSANHIGHEGLDSTPVIVDVGHNTDLLRPKVLG